MSPDQPENSGELPASPDVPEAIAEGELPAGQAPSLVDIVEAVLFASLKPVSAKELLGILRGAADGSNPVADALKKTKDAELVAALEELAARCAGEGRTYEVRESAAGWQLVTRATFSPWLRQLFPENRPARLSAPAMETLAIIAYRQPITRADIEAVRGVSVDGVMQTLLDRGLVKIAGRAEIPGRPLLYETTQFFMEHFGIRNLDELPNAGELRKMDLPTATPAPEEPPELPLEPGPEPKNPPPGEEKAGSTPTPDSLPKEKLA
jgi:segregation and condensation protein B